MNKPSNINQIRNNSNTPSPHINTHSGKITATKIPVSVVPTASQKQNGVRVRGKMTPKSYIFMSLSAFIINLVFWFIYKALKENGISTTLVLLIMAFFNLAMAPQFIYYTIKYLIKLIIRIYKKGIQKPKIFFPALFGFVLLIIFGIFIFNKTAFSRDQYYLDVIQEEMNSAAYLKSIGDRIVILNVSVPEGWDSDVVKSSSLYSQYILLDMEPEIKHTKYYDYYNSAIVWLQEIEAGTASREAWKNVSAKPPKFSIALNDQDLEMSIQKSITKVMDLQEFSYYASLDNNDDAKRSIAAKILVQIHWLENLTYADDPGFWASGTNPFNLAISKIIPVVHANAAEKRCKTNPNTCGKLIPSLRRIWDEIECPVTQPGSPFIWTHTATNCSVFVYNSSWANLQNDLQEEVVATPAPEVTDINKNKLFFFAYPNLPDAIVGIPYTPYSFCVPDTSRDSTFCGGVILGDATNPIGGYPPYTFVHKNGFIPSGMVLEFGGLLRGTPALFIKSQTSYQFDVCVTDTGSSLQGFLDKQTYCSRTSITVKPNLVEPFKTACTEKAGTLGNNGMAKDNLPTNEEGYECWSKDEKCWEYLTYSGKSYKGGADGCPKLNLEPQPNAESEVINYLKDTQFAITNIDDLVATFGSIVDNIKATLQKITFDTNIDFPGASIGNWDGNYDIQFSESACSMQGLDASGMMNGYIQDGINVSGNQVQDFGNTGYINSNGTTTASFTASESGTKITLRVDLQFTGNSVSGMFYLSSSSSILNYNCSARITGSKN